VLVVFAVFVVTGAAAGPPSHVLLRAPNRAVSPAVLTPRYLVWVSGPINAENVPTLLRQRDLRTGRTTTLARGVDANGGLASTARWVAYVSDEPTPVLLAVRHDGRRRHVLARNVVTAVAARGDRIAWAEQVDDRQVISVLNLSTERRWIAARLPRCVHSDCYRIDYITLADKGVVFTRGAIGPQPSFVFRRSFEGRLERVRLPGDAQPDLAPSSAGALYYHYAHGWYRWDFGRRRPALTRYRSSRPAVLAFERDSWYLKVGPSCRPNVIRVDPGGRAHPVVSGTHVKRAVHVPASDCATLSDIKVAASHVLSLWALMPVFAIGAHVDFDLVGAAVSG
jgi:hypothetical protein